MRTSAVVALVLLALAGAALIVAGIAERSVATAGTGVFALVLGADVWRRERSRPRR